jgi:hypothetical protein
MNINNNRRRSFRPKHNNRGGFRRRSPGSSQGQNGHYKSNNGNVGYNRNGSMSNPFNLEKTIQKFIQLAKDAQSLGDPVVVENYLQHADHYSRRLAEINLKNTSAVQPNKEDNLNEPSQKISKEEPVSNDEKNS